jgi:hypothetical protein
LHKRKNKQVVEVALLQDSRAVEKHEYSARE